jgi:hypothetical protein
MHRRRLAGTVALYRPAKPISTETGFPANRRVQKWPVQ